MKKVSLIILSIFLFSCGYDRDDFSLNKRNEISLDSLKNYSDYILGDFNGEFFVSTHVSTKSYGATTVSLPLDSSHIQYQIAYKIIDKGVEKCAWVTFRFLEAKTKLDADNNYHYKYFSDFVGFFNRNKFNYLQSVHPKENIHNVAIQYQNYYDINQAIDRYSTNEYLQQMTSENFNFTIDSVKAIENPNNRKIEVYYSFNCIGVNHYLDEFKINTGKGKSTFEYNF